MWLRATGGYHSWKILCTAIHAQSGPTHAPQCCVLAKINGPVYLLVILERAPLRRKNFLFFIFPLHAMPIVNYIGYSCTYYNICKK